MELNKIIEGDALKTLKTFESKSINMCITSPPYWGLRNYKHSNQLGQEKTPEEYISNLCDIFDEVYRVLKNDGSLWVNLGDTYINKKHKLTDYKNKSLALIPHLFVIEMCKRGWICRNNIIWHKPNAMPSPVKDRFTVDFEYIFLFVKQEKYYFEQQKEKNKDTYNGKRGTSKTRKKLESAMRGDISDVKKVYETRNIRTTWSINTKPFKEAHFATYPDELIKVPILSGCPINGIVLDPFIGSGTTAIVALELNRNFIGIELVKDSVIIANNRINFFLREQLNHE